MTPVDTHDPKRVTGYRMDQLASAFDRVRNPRDWMAPIRAVIQPGDQPLVEKAVLWFTGTIARFERDPGHADRLIVVASGYRLGHAARDEPAVAQKTVFLPSMSATLARAIGDSAVADSVAAPAEESVPAPAPEAVAKPITPGAQRRLRRKEPYVRPLDVRWDGASRRYGLFPDLETSLDRK